ncbi:MAG: hypothetical protein GXO36_05490, partial [Chloroflexi bacterium]|nr:hypothetical protein [Chloroflexota bacterium]
MSTQHALLLSQDPRLRAALDWIFQQDARTWTLRVATDWDEVRGELLEQPYPELVILDLAEFPRPEDRNLRWPTLQQWFTEWRTAVPRGRLIVLRSSQARVPSWASRLSPDRIEDRDLPPERWLLLLDSLSRPEYEVLLAPPPRPELPPTPPTLWNWVDVTIESRWAQFRSQ